MSDGLGLTTILGCLQAGEQFAHLDPAGWLPGLGADQGQVLFANLQASWRPGLQRFDRDALQLYATDSHPQLIAKMREWAMQQDPPPPGGRGSMYLISQVKELGKWRVPGQRVERGVGWNEFQLNASFFTTGDDQVGVVASVVAKNGDMVYMTRAPETVSGMDFYTTITEIELQMKPLPRVYDKVVPPCVNASIHPYLGWILGLVNGGNFISYAQQGMEFGMNEFGFAVKEGAVIETERSIQTAPRQFFLSPDGKAFLFWRRRAGVLYPASMFQFTRDDFRDPGDLAKIVE